MLELSFSLERVLAFQVVTKMYRDDACWSGTAMSLCRGLPSTLGGTSPPPSHPTAGNRARGQGCWSICPCTEWRMGAVSCHKMHPTGTRAATSSMDAVCRPSSTSRRRTSTTFTAHILYNPSLRPNWSRWADTRSPFGACLLARKRPKRARRRRKSKTVRDLSSRCVVIILLASRGPALATVSQKSAFLRTSSFTRSNPLPTTRWWPVERVLARPCCWPCCQRINPATSLAEFYLGT